MPLLEDLNAFITAGNTQPGGFYDGGATLNGGFPRASSPCGGAQTPPTPQPAMGHETRKLFSSFVQASVARNERSPPAAFAPGPGPVVQPAGPPGVPPKWQINESMMNQKWGTVLRTLQPSATNTALPTSVAMRPAQAPAYLIGKSYDPQGYAPHRSRSIMSPEMAYHSLRSLSRRDPCLASPPLVFCAQGQRPPRSVSNSESGQYRVSQRASIAAVTMRTGSDGRTPFRGCVAFAARE